MSMEDLNIRPGRPSDFPTILQMIRDLAIYERCEDEVLMTEAELRREAFGDNPSYEFVIGEVGDKAVAMAIYYYCFSTWKGRYLYLEDFYVEPAFRSKGIGAQIFQHLIGICKSQGLRRMSWQVLDWNEPAIGFYKKMQADLDAGWINGDLDLTK